MSKTSRAYLIYEILLFEYSNRWTGHIRFYKSGFTAVCIGHVHRAFSYRSVYINVAHQLTTIDLEFNKGNLVDVNYSEVLCCLLMSHTLNFRHQIKENRILNKNFSAVQLQAAIKKDPEHR